MLRIVLLVVILVMAPTAAFFLWAWAVKIKQERKLAGTLPQWQDLPLTWLGIAGLACTIAGFIVMFFTQNDRGRKQAQETNAPSQNSERDRIGAANDQVARHRRGGATQRT